MTQQMIRDEADTETSTECVVADDRAAVHIWGNVMRGYKATNQKIHARLKKDFDLNGPEIEALLTLHLSENYRERMSTLAKATSFSSGGFTKVADRLADLGYTERAADPVDRRVIYLELTEPGREKAAELFEAGAQLNRELILDVLGTERGLLLGDLMGELLEAHRGF